VASVRRGKKHVIGVVFGGASAASRNSAMRTYLNMGLVKASNEKTRQPAAALVAQAPQPALDRKIGAVPKPQRVARSPASPVVAAAAPPPATPPPSAEPAAVQPPPASRPAIEIARVRSILVTPRSTGPAADEPRERAVLGPREHVPARAQVGPEERDQPAAEATAPPVPPPMRTWTTAANLAPPTYHPAAPADRPALFADPTLGRGATPSTLEQQASNLARGDPAVTAPTTTAALPAQKPLAPVKEPAVAAPATAALPRGGFQIQIGAFQSQAEAERQLATARERTGPLLARGAPVTQQVQQGEKVYFRARYSGFDAPTAGKACSELKRLKIDCIVVKAE
jgi:D-alanyl-D-alanine carboxypeptidase